MLEVVQSVGIVTLAIVIILIGSSIMTIARLLKKKFPDDFMG